MSNVSQNTIKFNVRVLLTIVNELLFNIYRGNKHTNLLTCLSTQYCLVRFELLQKKMQLRVVYFVLCVAIAFAFHHCAEGSVSNNKICLKLNRYLPNCEELE